MHQTGGDLGFKSLISNSEKLRGMPELLCVLKKKNPSIEEGSRRKVSLIRARSGPAILFSRMELVHWTGRQKESRVSLRPV